MTAEPWHAARIVAALLALDPAGLGGVVVRAHAGPVRDRWLALLRRALPPGSPFRKLPAGIGDDRLLGGLDLSATLRAGRPIGARGLLAECDGGLVLVPSAERLSAGTAARLAAAIDTGTVSVEREGMRLTHPARLAVVALDEGLKAEERPPAALLDRLAFSLDLTHLRLSDTDEDDLAEDIAVTRAALAAVAVPDETLAALTSVALALGVSSLRATLLAVRAARAAAAFAGEDAVSADTAALAAELVLAPRATRLPASDAPAPEPEPESDAPPPDTDTPNADELTPSDRALEDVVLAAAAAAIPKELLRALTETGRLSAKSSGGVSGLRRQSAHRGRPIGVRPGELRGGARLALVDTLRAAAPWQPVRKRMTARAGIVVRREDFRIRRFEERSDSTTIFLVDASGSSALHRLAEAKGAVELLLADCYVRRDQVAVVAFRGAGAEIVLAPTRSLVRAKRALAGLPGGGATPLAAGIDAGLRLALDVRRRGASPGIVLMTDGRGNIARSGAADRPQAAEDAARAGRAVAASRIPAILVDTSPRPRPEAEALAAAMAAPYVPLPRADAGALDAVVRRTLIREK